MRLTTGPVNSRSTILRKRVWRGGSTWLSTSATSQPSRRNSWSASVGSIEETSRRMSMWLENTSHLCEASTMSAWRVTSQRPILASKCTGASACIRA